MGGCEKPWAEKGGFGVDSVNGGSQVGAVDKQIFDGWFNVI